jgi:hypothetical protein
MSRATWIVLTAFAAITTISSIGVTVHKNRTPQQSNDMPSPLSPTTTYQPGQGCYVPTANQTNALPESWTWAGTPQPPAGAWNIEIITRGAGKNGTGTWTVRLLDQQFRLVQSIEGAFPTSPITAFPAPPCKPLP